MPERLIIAALFGVAGGAFVWAASDVLDAPRRWLGAILMFGLTTANVLLALRSRRGRGGR